MKFMKFLINFFMKTLIVTISLIPISSFAQIIGSKPIRIIVAFPAGGPTDLLGRILTQKMVEGLNTPVIIENRAGAGGNLGMEMVARSIPDGQTLLLATISFVINPHLYRKIGYDPLKDFVPITLLSSTPYIMMVHPSVPAHDVKTLVIMAKRYPGRLNYASAGSGTAAHLAGELFKTAAGVDIMHIPYKGAAPALADLIAGQVTITFNNPLTALPHIKSGKARGLAVTTAQRIASAPNIPTLIESGIRGVDVGSWSAIFAPAGTPLSIIARYHNEISRILSIPEIKVKLVAEGAVPIGSGPEELGQFVKTEFVKWSKVVAQSGARVD